MCYGRAVPPDGDRFTLDRLIAILLIVWVGWTVGAGSLRVISRGVPADAALASGELLDRFGVLKDRLPTSETVGYASPLNPADPAFQMRQMMARYALVPVRLDSADTHRVVLADFETDAALRTYVQAVRGVVRAHPDIGLAIVERPTTVP